MTDSPDHSTEVSSRRAAREGTAGRAATASPIAGIQALIAKHPTVWLFSAIGVVFLLLATGSLFAGIASGSGRAEMVPLPAGSEAPPRTQPSAVPAEKLEGFGEDIPLGRPGQPAELASTYVYLASEEASYTSGETIVVSGGNALH